jgi:nitrite reductase/ring-hydroxylating ferredoxin subunit
MAPISQPGRDRDDGREVASTADLAPGAAKCVEVAGKKIALFNLEGSFYAIDDTCTHRGGPLSEGEVSGEEVTCPWHGAIYNIKTGAVLGPPAPRGVARYAVRVQGSDVEVEV